MPLLTSCPSCSSSDLRQIYELHRVPVHSVVLLHSRAEAINYPQGDLLLSHCDHCGFIFNAAYDPQLQDYSSEYESTQAYSPTYNAFADRLANYLVEQYDLHGKEIIEIGCGQGEFISALCQIGSNRGIGFDPAYTGRPAQENTAEGVTFISDFYSEKYADLQADFYFCKMTLEHIQFVSDFVKTVKRAVGNRADSVVFFQIPDVTRVLREIAFWDIYYEHCSYFSPSSLARLFTSSGFLVTKLWNDYDDQYLMIEARPGTNGEPTPDVEIDEENHLQLVNFFEKNHSQKIRSWRERIQAFTQNQQKIVLWGSGSKGVAFLTTLGVFEEIVYTVDINPQKSGTFMAGTGQEIIAPSALQEYKPDIVVLMNPIYQDEVQAELHKMGLNPQLICLE